MGHPWLLFHLFSSFQTNITIFTKNKCETCPSSILWWDSNPQPSEHETPPITIRPGLPGRVVMLRWFNALWLAKKSCDLTWSIKMLGGNEALWVIQVTWWFLTNQRGYLLSCYISNVTSFSHSESFILALHRYATPNLFMTSDPVL